VLEPNALDMRDAGNGGNLIEHQILRLARRHHHFPASKASQIGKAGMGADGHAVGFGAPDSGAKDAGIACVKTRGDVC